MEYTIIIKKGQWYYTCCESDLYEAEEDFEDKIYFDDDGLEGLNTKVFNTKEEALAHTKKTQDD